MKHIQSRNRTTDMVYTAMGAVLIALCAWISIPTAVPFTMQTFGVFLVLSALGGKRGTAAILLYLLLGTAGVPVFAQFTSGIGVLLGNRGGYLAGFLFTGLIYWLLTGLFGKKLRTEITALVLGLAALYTFGTFWYVLVYAGTNGPVGIGTALAWCVVPFIIPDLLKLGLALLLSRRLSSVLK